MANRFRLIYFKSITQTRSGKELLGWIVAILLAVLISLYGLHQQAEVATVAESALLFGINSVVFLAIRRDFPTLGVVMLIFSFVFELSLLGYFVLLTASFSA